MKDRINPPVRWRKFEADRHRTNDLGDSKRAYEFRGKFVTNGTERNVLRWKPQFLTDDIDGRPRPVAISLGLGARPHLEEGLSGPAPGASTPLDKCVGRGKRKFGFQTGKNRWLVPWATLKRRQARARYWKLVMCVLNPWELLAPRGRILRDHTSQHTF